MKKYLLALLAGTTIMLSACSNQTAYIHNTAKAKLAYDESQSFFLFGVGQEKSVDAVQICGDEQNITKVENQATAGNILISGLTFGIYTPRTSRVYCQQ